MWPAPVLEDRIAGTAAATTYVPYHAGQPSNSYTLTTWDTECLILQNTIFLKNVTFIVQGKTEQF